MRLVLLLILISFTLSASDKTEQIVKMHATLNGSCNYPVKEIYKDDEEVLCALGKLAERCNKIDDCYFYCFGNDLGDGIGGGCAHICNRGNKKSWERPEGILSCKNEAE